MGFLDNLQLTFMSNREMVKIAGDVKTSKEQLAKLCKSGDLQVLDALTDNLNTPDRTLYLATIKAIQDKKQDRRSHAAEVIIYKIRHNRKSGKEALKSLEIMLVHLLKETDWIRGKDIVIALGVLRSRIATDTICKLMHIAFKNYQMYKEQEKYQLYGKGEIIRMKTDTDTRILSPSNVFSGFVTHAIIALGKIGDPEALTDIASIGEKDEGFKKIAESAIKKIKKEKK